MTEIILMTDGKAKVFPLIDGQILLAGSAPNCDILLPSGNIGPHHVAFASKGGVCGVKHLAQSKETYLNGVRLSKAKTLHDGDVVQVGSFSLHFSTSQEKENNKKTSTPSKSTTKLHSATILLPRAMMADMDGMQAYIEKHRIPDPSVQPKD